MASAAIDTEAYAEHSFDDILSADPSIYSDSCSAFEGFQYLPLDLSNPEAQVAAETLSQDATDVSQLVVHIITSSNAKVALSFCIQ